MTENKKHLCPVCQQEDWHSLDTVVITCPKCMGQKSIQTAPDQSQVCDLCQGNGRVNYQLRDQKYWFDKNILYDEAVGMKICKACGFVTYSPRWSEEELRIRYTKERGMVNAVLIAKANLKNEFHKFFLGSPDDFKTVLDIGCSFGNVRQVFLNAEIHGLEYASRFAKYAREVNGIQTIKKTQDLPDKSKDLVMMYHTLEHVSDPRETLLEAKRILKSDGFLYVAVPDYLGILHEVSGSACIDFESLYHLNHNNVFSHASLNNLLRQCGFEVVKMNNKYYGEAVLCKINENVDKTLVKEEWPKIENILYRQRMAIDILSRSFRNQNSDQAVMGLEAAIAQYPQYVDAYDALMMQKNHYKDTAALLGIYQRAMDAGCETSHLRNKFATILVNWCDAGDVNNYLRKAVELLEKSLDEMPGDYDALLLLFKITAYNFKNISKAEEYAARALKINPMMWAEVQNVLAQVRCLE